MSSGGKWTCAKHAELINFGRFGHSRHRDSVAKGPPHLTVWALA